MIGILTSLGLTNNSLREILEVIEKDNINPAKWMELAEYYDILDNI